jgi:peptidyl-prolyl cis-trans isomerase C
MSLLLAVGLSAPVVAADKPVAEVNGTPITQAMIDVYAEHRQQLRPGQVPQEQLVNEVIGKVLVYQDAVAKGLDKDPELMARIERLRREVIVSDALDVYAAANPVTEEELTEVYNEAVAQNIGNEYKARHILVESEDDARAIIVELDAGADFAELAKSKSTGPSGKQGGDLGWFREGTMVAPFSEAAAKLEKGSYTKEPVKTRFGWHVILLEDTRPIEPPPLDDVREQLQQQLEQIKLQAYVEELREKATIK